MNRFMNSILHLMGVGRKVATMNQTPFKIERMDPEVKDSFYKKRNKANRAAKKSRSINKHYNKYR